MVHFPHSLQAAHMEKGNVDFDIRERLVADGIESTFGCHHLLQSDGRLQQSIVS